ncbi:MAG: hypothetical protein Q7U16_16970 [Agitococcus sp.]|nr:hypothetical protein [Agitococcus sp.]
MNCAAQTQPARMSRSSKPRPKRARTLPAFALYTSNMVNKTSTTPHALNLSFLTFANTHKPSCASAPRALSVTHDLLMNITIEVNFVSQLKQLVMEACGDLAACIRMQPIARTTKMKISFSLSKPAIDLIMHTVMCGLPSAEFGRITTA